MLRALAESSAWQQRQVQHLLLQHRYLPEAPTEALFGDVPAEWRISENGLDYKLDLGRKQNNGLFLDMRYGRRWVQEHARGKRVLNLFATPAVSRSRRSPAAPSMWSTWTWPARR